MGTEEDSRLDPELVEAARQVRLRAHAPYSNFLVGAAIRTQSGAIITGCNVENASYGLTICAERAAACSAVALGHRHWSRIAIATCGRLGPCGACLQVLAEFAPDLPILLVDAEGRLADLRSSVGELLPGAFRLNRS